MHMTATVLISVPNQCCHVNVATYSMQGGSALAEGIVRRCFRPAVSADLTWQRLNAGTLTTLLSTCLAGTIIPCLIYKQVKQLVILLPAGGTQGLRQPVGSGLVSIYAPICGQVTRFPLL